MVKIDRKKKVIITLLKYQINNKTKTKNKTTEIYIKNNKERKEK